MDTAHGKVDRRIEERVSAIENLASIMNVDFFTINGRCEAASPASDARLCMGVQNVESKHIISTTQYLRLQIAQKASSCGD